ncbi:MAG TPA: DUF952 domain-containing protein [Polyangiaceae bacterium]
MTELVYKICSRSAFREAEATGALAPSADDARDGYVHLSSEPQVAGTLKRHFRGQRALVLLSVAVDRLPDGELRWEASRDGQLFPHLYGTLPVSAVIEVTEIDDAEPRLRPR